ncbi:MAG: hypothetical protein JNM25_13085 [Planctomycetes bacterium]|nr:hypothetical protein [Planctomycetota bacterium]
MPPPKPRAADDPPVAAAAPQVPHDDLHRVRDILFGAHQRDTHRRLDQLEQRVDEQFAALRRELASAVGGESTTLQHKLEQAVAATNAAWRQANDDLRRQVQQELAELSEAKLDRSALAGLLGGLADRLGNDQAAPGR